MVMKNSISIIGGDLRQLTLAELLKENGYDVYVYGFGSDYVSEKYNVTDDIFKLLKNDIIILPIPVTQDFKTINAPFSKEPIPLSYIKECSKNAKLILGGKITKEINNMCYNSKIIDYSNREELMIKNAIATAEGALEIALSETAHTIWNSKCIITGFGRIGKVLSRMLKNMGADVYVAARKHQDLAWIETNGYHPVLYKDLKDVLKNADIIFNTVPSLIFDNNVLKSINQTSPIIDLASKPGGVDFETAKDLGLNVIWALSLPGKVAPITSGKIIHDTIINIFNEEGV